MTRSAPATKRHERRVHACLGVLDVADVADAAAAMVEAVSGGAAGMSEQAGADRAVAAECQGLPRHEARMLDGAGQAREAQREERLVEHPVQRSLRRGAAEIAAMNANRGSIAEQRLEEGEPGDVVVVKMAEEQVDAGMRLLGENLPEADDAGAGVDDEHAVAEADLDAGRIAAVALHPRVGHRERAPHTPEADRNSAQAARLSMGIEVKSGATVRSHLSVPGDRPATATVIPSLAFSFRAARSLFVASSRCARSRITASAS